MLQAPRSRSFRKLQGPSLEASLLKETIGLKIVHTNLPTKFCNHVRWLFARCHVHPPPNGIFPAGFKFTLKHVKLSPASIPPAFPSGFFFWFVGMAQLLSGRAQLGQADDLLELLKMPIRSFKVGTTRCNKLEFWMRHHCEIIAVLEGSVSEYHREARLLMVSNHPC